MAVGRIILTFLCAITCALSQWQKGLSPSSENGFNDLLEAVSPVTLQTKTRENTVEISVTYQSRVFAVPFWTIEIEGDSDLMHSLGRSQEEGEMVVSSVEVSKTAVVTELSFHLSSKIGEVVLDLQYEELKELVMEIELPTIGVRPLVPPVYKPIPVESACIGQYIYVKFEKEDDEINLQYGRDVEFTFVENEGNYLDREGDYDYHHFLEKNKHFYGMEIELKSEYVKNGSEVSATYRTYRISGNAKNSYIKSVSKTVHSLIVPPDPVQHIFFHDELGLFQRYKQTIKISDKLENRAISCAAFGFPKPGVELSDENGNVLPSTEVTLDNGMTTHVIASMENVPFDQIQGNYKCVASNGHQDIEQTITLKTL